MKVLLLNGSPNKNGNTSKMLQIIDEELKKYGVSTEWLDLGKTPVHGCIDCGHCKTAKRCIFEDGLCNRGSCVLFHLHMASDVFWKIRSGSCNTFSFRGICGIGAVA